METTPQQNRPAELALLSGLAPSQLDLVADWLREELALFEQDYASGGAKKRVGFIADRLAAIAQNSVPMPPVSDVEEPWRFSDEYWEKYEANDD